MPNRLLVQRELCQPTQVKCVMRLQLTSSNQRNILRQSNDVVQGRCPHLAHRAVHLWRHRLPRCYPAAWTCMTLTETGLVEYVAVVCLANAHMPSRLQRNGWSDRPQYLYLLAFECTLTSRRGPPAPLACVCLRCAKTKQYQHAVIATSGLSERLEIYHLLMSSQDAINSREGVLDAGVRRCSPTPWGLYHDESCDGVGQSVSRIGW